MTRLIITDSATGSTDECRVPASISPLWPTGQIEAARLLEHLTKENMPEEYTSLKSWGYVIAEIQSHIMICRSTQESYWGTGQTLIAILD